MTGGGAVGRGKQAFEKGKEICIKLSCLLWGTGGVPVSFYRGPQLAATVSAIGPREYRLLQR
jgi:hypothetical protein